MARYFLADRVVEMTVEMFREPRKMVQEISGLGLRHALWSNMAFLCEVALWTPQSSVFSPKKAGYPISKYLCSYI